MNVLPDPVTDVIGLVFRHAAQSKLWQRVELLLEMYVIAAPIAFLMACGSALMARQPVAWSIGAGMVFAAVALLATFKASKNSAGLIISIPADTTEKQLETPMSTIERAKQ